MRPLIGITPGYDDVERKTFIKFGYQEAIIEVGGVPVIIPPTGEEVIINELFNRIDGLILTGGPDFDGKFFNEETLKETTDISPVRDEMEIYLAQLSIKSNKPVLGI